MSHRNAPLTPEGRRRLVARCQHRPIAHIAAESGVSRQCLSKWVGRYRSGGEDALADRSSAPACRPTRTPQPVVEEIVRLRKKHRWSAVTIAGQLRAQGTPVAVVTVTRHLRAHGLNQRRWLDPETGEPNREQPKPGKIVARYPGHMIHLDVKKSGKIPDGGGWRVHGRGSEQAKAAGRARPRGQRAGYTYLHSAVDGFSRLAYTEPHDDEKAITAIGFLSRARVFFAAHGITRITRVVTDNGSCYRAGDFNRSVLSFAAKHQRIKPYTPKHNGKVERYQQTLGYELLYAQSWNSETERRQAIGRWLIHYNYHRSHTTAGGKPPASRLKTGVTNVMTNNN